MSSRPEEPAADNHVSKEDAGRRGRQDASEWEVPHQTQPPGAPPDFPPGTFVVEGDAGQPSARAPLRHVVDVAAVATVVANLPWMAGSFVVVVLILWLLTALLSVDFLLPPLTWAWLASGVIVFIPAAEPYVAAYVLGLRRPTESEETQLGAAWGMVAEKAGLAAGSYSLWIDDHAYLNTCKPSGRFLAVSRSAASLPRRQQAAFLAHELSHQLGGHAWARMLVQWYAAPARWVVRMYRMILRMTRRGGQMTGPAGATLGCLVALIWLVLGVAIVGGLITTPALRPAIVVLPFLPWLSRWAEKRCDRVAADLGFGRDLMELFRNWQDSGRDDGSATGVIGRLFASQPTVGARMHALQQYLAEKGVG
jgi:Zn-dependent protease with chaperone function